MELTEKEVKFLSTNILALVQKNGGVTPYDNIRRQVCPNNVSRGSWEASYALLIDNGSLIEAEVPSVQFMGKKVTQVHTTPGAPVCSLRPWADRNREDA